MTLNGHVGSLPRTVSHRLVLCILLLAYPALASSPSAITSFNYASNRTSVVKVYATYQADDYSLPWQSGHPASGTGSGFIIEKRRILTNAHVVSNTKFLQVQKDGDTRRYAARVLFAGHDCDLALLAVDDEEFHKNTVPVAFAEDLPGLSDEVTVLGYPLGGDRLSLTRGVVSRIDYSLYSHSGLDQHLVLQVDAAINPGNSGGPIFFGGKVVGLAFQGIVWADNIGYGIPVPVLRHFLDDVADGTYDGYPELGAFTLDTRNPSLRQDLGLRPDEGGIVVYHLDPFGSAMGYIRVRDVLLSIDGFRIEDDGTIDLKGTTVLFAEMLERKQSGNSVSFGVRRDGKDMTITVPLRQPADPFVFRNLYDKRPRYLIAAGLVFSPLNGEYLKTLDDHPLTRNTQQLLYYGEYAKVDDLYKDRDEFVVMIRRLPHAVNTYSDSFVNGIVEEVNGTRIRKLEDLREALKKPTGGFHVFTFAGMEETLVLDAAATAKADPEILSSYGIPAPENFKETDLP